MISTLRNIGSVRSLHPFSRESITGLPAVFAEKQNTYDKIGRLIGDGKYDYVYNDFSELKEIRDNSTGDLVEEYFYDDESIRMLSIKYHSNGTVKEKVFTPFKHFMQIENDSGVFNFTYVYADGTLIARDGSDGSLQFYHPDALGSPNVITDNAGGVVEEIFEKPFGGLDGSEPKIETRIGFTGHELDEGTGLIYAKARYYNPKDKFWIQPDTLLPNVYDPQQLNRYMYVRGNPFKFVDEDGKELIGASLLLGTIYLVLLLATVIGSVIYSKQINQETTQVLEPLDVPTNSIEANDAADVTPRIDALTEDKGEEFEESLEFEGTLTVDELAFEAADNLFESPNFGQGTINSLDLRSLTLSQLQQREKRRADAARRNKQDAIDRLKKKGTCGRSCQKADEEEVEDDE